MKKRLFGLLAMASVICVTGCLKDEVLSQATGDEVTVTFTTELRTTPKTKAVGDDVNDINKLEVAVYDAEGNYLPDVEKKVSFVEYGENGTKKYAVNLVLVKGQTYQFAFWAQNSGYDAYSFVPADKTVTIDYEKVTANNRSADAFFANVPSAEVNEAFTKEVTLKRPFAQVNFLTSEADFNNAMNAAFVPESQIVVDKVASSLNVLTGEVTVAENSQPVTFAKSSLLKKDADTYESTTIGDATYYYVATAYVLPTVATGEDKVTATMTVMDDVDLVARDITVQRNYRTNIYGDLLTENGTFEVTVDPAFIDSDDEPYNEEVAQLAFADAAKNGGTFRLRRNFTIPQSDTESGYEVTAGAEDGADTGSRAVVEDDGMVIDLNGFALNGKIVNKGKLTIKDSDPTPETIAVSKLELDVTEAVKTTITAGYYSTKVPTAPGYEAEEYTNESAEGDSEVVYKVVPVPTASTWDELMEKVKNGKEQVILVNDVVNTGAATNTILSDLCVDLNGYTLSNKRIIRINNGPKLVLRNGQFVSSASSSYIDVRPTSANGFELIAENVKFVNNYYLSAPRPNTTATDRVDYILKTYPQVTGEIPFTMHFKNCEFNNASLCFGGSSNQISKINVVFENCTFTALTANDALIEIGNYVSGDLTVKDCTFNMTCTHYDWSPCAIKLSTSSDTKVKVYAENNKFEATKAEAYTYNPELGETKNHSIYVYITKDFTVKFIKYDKNSANTSTIVETGTTYSGIASTVNASTPIN